MYIHAGGEGGSINTNSLVIALLTYWYIYEYIYMYVYIGDNCCFEYGVGGFKGMIEHLLPGIYVKSLQIGSTPTMVIN